MSSILSVIGFPLSFFLSVSSIISVFIFSCPSSSLSPFSPFSVFGFRCRSSPLFRQFSPFFVSAVFLSLCFVHYISLCLQLSFFLFLSLVLSLSSASAVVLPR